MPVVVLQILYQWMQNIVLVNLFYKVYRNYKRISLMTNYVPINNTILRDIVRCFNSQYWSRFMNKRVGLVFDEKTHCFQSYNQGYRKTGNN